MIKVLLVDDSPMVLHILQRLLSRSPDIQIAGTAANGRDALELLPALRPDVICTDLHMPVMDGLEFTREVMDRYPCPILVVSVSVEPGSGNVFRLIEAGAVDVFPKPHDILAADQEKLARELISKVRVLSGVSVFRRSASIVRPVIPPVVLPGFSQVPVRMVVIGASTGGPQALHDILTHLPAGFTLPVVCVQHIGSSFVTELVSWLNGACPLPIRVAVQDETPQPGVVYFAPGEVHLEMDDACGRFVFSYAPAVDGHRPSVSVTMKSVARCFGAGTLGVLLTGMGSDGAEGLVSIASAGGITLAQDEQSCVVYGMPKEAVARGAVRLVLPLEQIAPMLVQLAAG